MLAEKVQHVVACVLSWSQVRPLLVVFFRRPFAPALSLLAVSFDSGLSCPAFGFDRARRCWSRVVVRHGFPRSFPPFPLPFSGFGCGVPICIRQVALRILAARFLCGLRSRSAGVRLPRSAPVSLKLLLEFADFGYQRLHHVLHSSLNTLLGLLAGESGGLGQGSGSKFPFPFPICRLLRSLDPFSLNESTNLRSAFL